MRAATCNWYKDQRPPRRNGSDAQPVLSPPAVTLHQYCPCRPKRLQACQAACRVWITVSFTPFMSGQDGFHHLRAMCRNTDDSCQSQGMVSQSILCRATYGSLVAPPEPVTVGRSRGAGNFTHYASDWRDGSFHPVTASPPVWYGPY